MKMITLLAALAGFNLTVWSQTLDEPVAATLTTDSIVFTVRPWDPEDPAQDVYLHLVNPDTGELERKISVRKTDPSNPNATAVLIVGVRPRPANDEAWFKFIEEPFSPPPAP